MGVKMKINDGFVFIDSDGYTWGWHSYFNMACGSVAQRPFLNEEEAKTAGNQCRFGFNGVRKWQKTDRVPPMDKTDSM